MPDGATAPYLSYTSPGQPVNWSDELEELHEDASKTHFLDRWTRAAILDGIAVAGRPQAVVDLGCSTGYLLEDLRERYPETALIGVDLVAAGLSKAHSFVPSALLVRADVTELPLRDGSVDVVVSANLLEHVPDDEQALREITRVLRPGGVAALIVPGGRSTYDYYDRFLGHERRYARGELAAKCRAAGLVTFHNGFIGSLLFPPFWAVKQRNRLMHGHLQGEDLANRVSGDIARTHSSAVGELLWRAETQLAARGVRLPFGIRSFVLAIRPNTG